MLRMCEVDSPFDTVYLPAQYPRIHTSGITGFFIRVHAFVNVLT